MAALPPELKQLKRFIREAKKTEKVSPVIAYYCRLYAIQEAMKLDESKKTAITKQWMGQQMSLLEENKADCSREEAKQKITAMAHNVFKHADEIDRGGNANKSTAAAFNSAFVFYTILKQFGDRDEQIVEAAKYCMFKTTDILKALKEGRKPKPGPPGDDPNDELNQELNALNDNNINNPSDNFSAPVQPTYNNSVSPQPQSQPSYQPQQPQQPSYQPQQPQQPSYQQPQQPSYQQPQQPSYQQPQQPTYSQPPKPQPQQQPTYNNNSGGYMVDNGPKYNYQKNMQLPRFEKKVEACVEAEKILKEAMAALRFEDVDTAIKKAEEAIGVLQPHNN